MFYGLAIEYERPIYITLRNVKTNHKLLGELSTTGVLQKNVEATIILWHPETDKIFLNKFKEIAKNKEEFPKTYILMTEKEKEKEFNNFFNEIILLIKKQATNLNYYNAVFFDSDVFTKKIEQICYSYDVDDDIVDLLDNLITHNDEGLYNHQSILNKINQDISENTIAEYDQNVVEIRNSKIKNTINNCVDDIYDNMDKILENINAKYFKNTKYFKNGVYSNCGMYAFDSYSDIMYDIMPKIKINDKLTFSDRIHKIIGDKEYKDFNREDARCIFAEIFKDTIDDDNFYRVIFDTGDEFGTFKLDTTRAYEIKQKFERLFEHNRKIYKGSLQLNLTLPYDINNFDLILNNIKDKHIKLMKYITILQPLLSAVFFIGEGNTFNQNCQNLRSMFSISDLAGLYTTNEFRDFYEKLESMNRFRYHNRKNDNGTFIMSLLNIFTEKECKSCEEMNENECISHRTKLHKLYEKLKKKSSTTLGADFRVNDKFYNIKEKKFFGFEYRPLQYIPKKATKMFIRLIILLIEYTKDIPFENEPLILMNQPEILNFIVNVNMNGWIAKVEPKYVNLLNKVFNNFKLDKLNTSNERDTSNELDESNCYNLLNSLYKIFHNHIRKIGFAKTIYIKYLDDEKEYNNIPPELENPNKIFNIMNITKYFILNPNILNKTMKILKEYKNITKISTNKNNNNDEKYFIENYEKIDKEKIIKTIDLPLFYEWVKYYGILEKNQKGGSYYDKYIKYKNKYLLLKKS